MSEADKNPKVRLFGAAADTERVSALDKAEALQDYLQDMGGPMTEPEWHVIEKRWSGNYGTHRADLVPFAHGKIAAEELIDRINPLRREHKPDSGEKFEKTTLDKVAKLAARILFARNYLQRLAAGSSEYRAKADAIYYVVKELEPLVSEKTLRNRWLGKSVK